MHGLILRIVAHHGEPILLGRVPVTAGISRDVPIDFTSIVNDPTNPGGAVRCLTGEASDYKLDDLINDFQDEHACKVNYDEPEDDDDPAIIEFDVFEPNWDSQQEAEDIVSDIQQRVSDWVSGHPTGR